METKPVSSSVVAKLMGIDESPKQQPVRKRRRVLSENYFRRVDSIGVRERCHPMRLVVDRQDYDDVFEVASTLKGERNLGLSELKTELSGQKKLHVSRGKYECFGEGGFRGLHKLSRSPLKSNRKGCSRSSEVAHNSARSFPQMSSLEAGQLVGEKHAEFSSPSSGQISVKQMEQSTKVPRLRSRGGKSVAIASEIINSPSLNFSYTRNQSFSYLDESYILRKANDQLSGQCRMTEKFSDYQRAVKGIAIREFLTMPVQEIGPNILDYKHGMHHRPRQKMVRLDSKNLDLSKFSKHQDRYDTLCKEWPFTPRRSINWGKSRSTEYKVTHKDGSRPIMLRTNNKKTESLHGLKSEGVLIGENAYVVHNDLKNDAVENDSDAKDTSLQKDTPMKVDEESTLPLHCSIPSDCNPSSEEVYQPSPVSVLDSLLGQENTPSPECFGSLNVDTSECSETYSEGSGMLVSSDDDSHDINEQCPSDYKENDLMEAFKVEESRDFSYLTDVLMEAGFYSRAAETDCDTWCFEECLMSLYVFECLEKKFGDQVSWNRSDRRLLFDRINDGLIEILAPSMGEPRWKNPVSRRIRTHHCQEMVEEDLWTLIVMQEKEGTEARKSLEEKLLRSGIGELELGDEIEFIGTEVERFLISELIDELVSNLA